jgi:DNA-binding response OmpR family regulator
MKGIWMRIVVLDDSKDILELLKVTFEGKGYEVFIFENPMICPLQMNPVCRCKENEKCTDLIITDINMPKMNGLEFLENHRKKKCNCEDVIIMSGKLDEDDTEKVKNLGCKAFRKPLIFDDLFEYIKLVKNNIKPNRRLRDWFLEVAKNKNNV